MSKIALIAITAVLIVLIYSFDGWAPRWLQGAVGLHLQGEGEGQGQGAAGDGSGTGDGKQYLGSIILSPRHGDKCWERGLDNRNGAMWEKGPVDCDVVPPLKALEDEAKGLAARRLKAIGKAFMKDGN